MLMLRYNFLDFSFRVFVQGKVISILNHTKSTTKKLKRKGPKMLPCGTPKLLSLMDELLSSI